MKIAAIRFVLCVLFLVGMIAFGAEGGPVRATLVDTLWAVMFAVGVRSLTGAAPLFIPLATFVLSALFPLAILLMIGVDAFGSVLAAATALLSSFAGSGPLWGGELLIPTLAAIATDRILARWHRLPVSGGA